MECTQLGRQNQHHHPILSKWKLRSFIMAEPGLYQERTSRAWLLTTVLCVTSSAGAIPSPLHSVAHSGRQEVRGVLEMMSFLRALLGRQRDSGGLSVGSCKEDAADDPFCIAGSWSAIL